MFCIWEFDPLEDTMANTPQELYQRGAVCNRDFSTLIEKEKTYDGSWKKRGGVGAYFTLVRPLDRFCQMVEKKYGFDIFKALETEDAEGRSGNDGSVLAALRDLRCYLILVESEFMLRRQAYASSPKEEPRVVDTEDRPPDTKRCRLALETLKGYGFTRGQDGYAGILVLEEAVEYLERKLP